jgi:ribosomal 30S subunit maturation factor RimM
VEDRVLGIEGKVYVIETSEDYKKRMNKANGIYKSSGTPLKDQTVESWELMKEKRYKLMA